MTRLLTESYCIQICPDLLFVVDVLMMICANGPDLHGRDKVASLIGRGIMTFLPRQKRYLARASAGIPRRRTKQDELDLRSALSQLAGHADAVLNDGQDSEEEGDCRGSVGIDMPESERVENADEERANADFEKRLTTVVKAAP